MRESAEVRLHGVGLQAAVKVGGHAVPGELIHEQGLHREVEVGDLDWSSSFGDMPWAKLRPPRRSAMAAGGPRPEPVGRGGRSFF